MQTRRHFIGAIGAASAINGILLTARTGPVNGPRTIIVPASGGRRTTIIPDFSDPDLKPLDSETPDETGNWKKAPNRSDGSE